MGGQTLYFGGVVLGRCMAGRRRPAKGSALTPVLISKISCATAQKNVAKFRDVHIYTYIYMVRPLCACTFHAFPALSTCLCGYTKPKTLAKPLTHHEPEAENIRKTCVTTITAMIFKHVGCVTHAGWFESHLQCFQLLTERKIAEIGHANKRGAHRV